MKHLVSRRLRVSLLSLLTAAFLSWWWRRRFKEGRQGLEPLLCVCGSVSGLSGGSNII